jgi:hypothetical protein
MAPDKKPSFWVTLPGILTGIATLITAIVGLLALYPKPAPTPEPPPPVPCKVTGFVYNSDTQPMSGLPDVHLAYIPANAASGAAPIPIATTSPTGEFAFDCTYIQKDQFPICLQMTCSWRGGTQIVRSPDQIYISGNPEMNLYLPLGSITNVQRVRTAIMPINFKELLQGRYSTLSNLAEVSRLPKDTITVVPTALRPARGTSS